MRTLDFLPIEVTLSVRGQLGENLPRALFSLFAVCISVSLATSVEIASRSVQVSIERTTRALSGKSDISISNGEIGVPERVLALVEGTSGIDTIEPILTRTVRLKTGERGGFPIQLIGLDFLAERKAHAFGVEENGVEVSDPLRLMADPRAVLLSKALLRRMNLSEGDSFQVYAGQREETLKVRGTISAGSAVDALQGQIGLMDVFALQELAGIRGRFDRIDVTVAGALLDERSEIARNLVERVGDLALVREGASESDVNARTLEALNWVVLAIATVGVVVAIFLAFGSTSVAVDRRTPALLMLVRVGMSPRAVKQLLLGEAVLTALVGTAIGVAAAAPLTSSAVGLFSSLSSHIDQRTIPSQPFEAPTLVLALVVGLLVPVLAVAGPASRLGSRTPESANRPRTAAAGWLCVLLAIASWFLIDHEKLRVGIAAAFYVVGAIALVVATIPNLVGRLRPVLEAVPGVGFLAGRSLAHRPVESGTVIVSASLVLGVVSCAAVVINSITYTMDAGILERYRGGYLATAQDPISSNRRVPLSEESVLRLQDQAGVEDVAVYRRVDVPFGEYSVSVYGYPVGVLDRRASLDGIFENPSSAVAGIQRGGVAVGHSLANIAGVGVGDSIMLRTRSGAREFEVVDLAYVFGDKGSAAYVSLDSFERYWGLGDILHLGVWTSGEDVADYIRSNHGDRGLFLVAADIAASRSQAAARQLDSLLWVLASVLGSLAGVGTLNLLLGSVLSRRRELATLSASGASPGHLAALVLTDAGLTAILSVLLGAITAAAFVLAAGHWLAGEIGWYLHWRIPWGQVSSASLAVAAAILMSAVYPAFVGAQTRSFPTETT